MRFRRLVLLIGGLGIVFLALHALEDDIRLYLLYPKIPFQIYKPPPAPDYSQKTAWYLNPAFANFYADPRTVDVFFVHGTSFNGGRHWLGPYDHPRADAEVEDRQLPNYAAPFAVEGAIYAPRYRQASLFTQFSQHDDSLAAREFAYGDVERAFEVFLKAHKGRRGFIIVGLEQGGVLAERLLLQRIAPNPGLRSELVAAYLIDAATPKSAFISALPLCSRKDQYGCVVAYLSVEARHLDLSLGLMRRAVRWAPPGFEHLTSMSSELVACVNPITGSVNVPDAAHGLSQGAANATGLEWPTQPALVTRRVSARCISGLLVVKTPDSVSFKQDDDWEALQKPHAYDLFYGDLQLGVKARWEAFQYANP